MVANFNTFPLTFKSQIPKMNKISTFSFLFLFTLIATNFGCSESTVTEDLENVIQGVEYFPLEIGKYISYQVDSTIFDVDGNSTAILNSTSYVLEEVSDTLRDSEGDLIYRIERSEKANLNDAWEIKDIWVSKRTEFQAERVEENLRYIKMVFPLAADATWNGNLYIDNGTIIPIAGESIEVFKNWTSELTLLGQPASINGLFFDEVTTISHADSENLIELRQVTEKYAKGVGLVEKEMWILDTQEIDQTKPWELKAEKGYILKQTVIDYN